MRHKIDRHMEKCQLYTMMGSDISQLFIRHKAMSLFSLKNLRQNDKNKVPKSYKMH